MTVCNTSTRRQESYLRKRAGLKKLIDEGYFLHLIWFSLKRGEAQCNLPFGAPLGHRYVDIGQGQEAYATAVKVLLKILEVPLAQCCNDAFVTA